jgi:hypothetical protein
LISEKRGQPIRSASSRWVRPVACHSAAIRRPIARLLVCSRIVPASEIQLTLLGQVQFRAGQLLVLVLNVCDTIVFDILIAADLVARVQRGSAASQRHTGPKDVDDDERAE